MVKNRRAKALFQYVSKNDDEIGFEIGDIIEILQQNEDGWWSGTLNGKTGYFPSNFVELEEVEKHAATKVVVAFPYASQSSDELNLEVGDVIIVLETELEDSGWWKGELNGKVGVFPSNFVDSISDNSTSQKLKHSTVDKTKATSSSARKEPQSAKRLSTSSHKSSNPNIEIKSKSEVVDTKQNVDSNSVATDLVEREQYVKLQEELTRLESSLENMKSRHSKTMQQLFEEMDEEKSARLSLEAEFVKVMSMVEKRFGSVNLVS